MISLRDPSGRAPLRSPLTAGGGAVAVLLTVSVFGATFATVSRIETTPRVAAAREELAAERIVWVASDLPRPSVAPVRAAPRSPAAGLAPRPVPRGLVSPAPRDTGSPRGTLPTEPARSSASSALVAAPPGAASRLQPPSARRSGTASWGSEVVFDPFAARSLPAPAVRDSLLGDLRAALPGMARARVRTAAERDALVKEGMLRNRQSGRTLLDPVVGDGTYSGRSGGIDAPLFSPGPSRAKRVRDSIAFAEYTARLARLQARIDSLRRTREP